MQSDSDLSKRNRFKTESLKTTAGNISAFTWTYSFKLQINYDRQQSVVWQINFVNQCVCVRNASRRQHNADNINLIYETPKSGEVLKDPTRFGTVNVLVKHWQISKRSWKELVLYVCYIFFLFAYQCRTYILSSFDKKTIFIGMVFFI